ncbi:MAG: hypothetical protein IJD10_02935, partial [Clostridia bacterium]|nr:hypothetical protein [Clostridia bacterium]
MKKINRFVMIVALLMAALLAVTLVSCDEKEPVETTGGGETTTAPSGDTDAPGTGDPATDEGTEPPVVELPTDAFGYLAAVLEKGLALDGNDTAVLGDNVLTQILVGSTADTELLIPGLNVDMKLYSSLTGGALELNANLAELPVDLKVYGNENSLAFGSSALLGSDAFYGTDLSKFKDSFANSIFANPEGLYYIGIESLDEVMAPIADATAMASKVEAILSRYFEAALKVMTDNGYATIAGDDNGKTVTVTLNGEGVSALLRALYNTAKTDADLRALVAEIVAMDPEANADEIMAEYDSLFTAEAELDELLAEISAVDFSLTFTVETDAEDAIKSASLVFKAVVDGEEGTISAVLDLSEANKAVFMIDLDLPESELEEEELPFDSIALIFSTDEDSDDRYVTSLTVEMDSGAKVQMELYKVTYDKKSGAFTLELGRGILEGDVITVKGTLTASDTECSLTVTEIGAAMFTEALGKDTFALDIRISVKAVDAIPAVPAYTDVLTLTE